MNTNQKNEQILYRAKCRAINSFIFEQIRVCEKCFKKVTLARNEKAPKEVVETEIDNYLMESMRLNTVLKAFTEDDVDKAITLIKKYTNFNNPMQRLLNAIYGYDSWKETLNTKDDDECSENDECDEDDEYDEDDEDGDANDDFEECSDVCDDDDCDGCPFKADSTVSKNQSNSCTDDERKLLDRIVKSRDKLTAFYSLLNEIL